MSTRSTSLRHLTQLTLLMLVLSTGSIIFEVFYWSCGWHFFDRSVAEIVLAAVLSIGLAAAGSTAATIVMAAEGICSGTVAKGSSDLSHHRPAAGSWTIYFTFLLLIALLAVLIFPYAADRIRNDRAFRREATTYLAGEAPQFAQAIESNPIEQTGEVPQEIVSLMNGAHLWTDLESVTLYAFDTRDGSSVRFYRPPFNSQFELLDWSEEETPDFKSALEGDDRALARLNQRSGCRFLGAVTGSTGKPVAVLEIRQKSERCMQE